MQCPVSHDCLEGTDLFPPYCAVCMWTSVYVVPCVLVLPRPLWIFLSLHIGKSFQDGNSLVDTLK